MPIPIPITFLPYLRLGPPADYVRVRPIGVNIVFIVLFSFKFRHL